jgi:hypothetical protein
MNLFHFEFQGKTARAVFSQLPPAKPRPHVVQKTAAGEVSRLRVLNGINPNVNPAKLSAADLTGADPELCLAQAGRRLDTDLSVAYLDPGDSSPKPIGEFKELDVIYDATGQEKERRPHLVRVPNLNTIHPIKIVRRLPMAEALTQFVFRASYQLAHEDGLTHDFLFQIARDLHEKQELALLGAGAKGNQPLVVREGGSPFRAFLYGEVGAGGQAAEYKLLVLLSDQELKKPAAPAPQQ